MTQYVYLARPVDQAKWDVSTPVMVCELARNTFEDVVLFSPADGWKVCGAAPDARLQTVNEAILAGCDHLLICYPAGMPSIGVWLELEHARRLDIPVTIVTDLQGSWALALLQSQGVRVIQATDDRGTETVVGEIVRAIADPDYDNEQNGVFG